MFASDRSGWWNLYRWRTGASEPVPIAPMEAELCDRLPEGDGWQYEPKWDGFRCLAFRDGREVRLRSKSGRPLERYFPDAVEGLLDVVADRFVLDGELVIPIGERFSFEELQLRLHPAERRVRKLAAAHPCLYVAFDLLVDADGTTCVDRPFVERRAPPLRSLRERPARGKPRLERELLGDPVRRQRAELVADVEADVIAVLVHHQLGWAGGSPRQPLALGRRDDAVAGAEHDQQRAADARGDPLQRELPRPLERLGVVGGARPHAEGRARAGRHLR